MTISAPVSCETLTSPSGSGLSPPQVSSTTVLPPASIIAATSRQATSTLRDTRLPGTMRRP